MEQCVPALLSLPIPPQKLYPTRHLADMDPTGLAVELDELKCKYNVVYQFNDPAIIGKCPEWQLKRFTHPVFWPELCGSVPSQRSQHLAGSWNAKSIRRQQYFKRNYQLCLFGRLSKDEHYLRKIKKYVGSGNFDRLPLWFKLFAYHIQNRTGPRCVGPVEEFMLDEEEDCFRDKEEHLRGNCLASVKLSANFDDQLLVAVGNKVLVASDPDRFQSTLRLILFRSCWDRREDIETCVADEIANIGKSSSDWVFQRSCKVEFGESILSVHLIELNGLISLAVRLTSEVYFAQFTDLCPDGNQFCDEFAWDFIIPGEFVDLSLSPYDPDIAIAIRSSGEHCLINIDDQSINLISPAAAQGDLQPNLLVANRVNSVCFANHPCVYVGAGAGMIQIFDYRVPMKVAFHDQTSDSGLSVLSGASLKPVVSLYDSNYCKNYAAGGAPPLQQRICRIANASPCGSFPLILAATTNNLLHFDIRKPGFPVLTQDHMVPCEPDYITFGHLDKMWLYSVVESSSSSSPTQHSSGSTSDQLNFKSPLDFVALGSGLVNEINFVGWTSRSLSAVKSVSDIPHILVCPRPPNVVPSPDFIAQYMKINCPEIINGNPFDASGFSPYIGLASAVDGRNGRGYVFHANQVGDLFCCTYSARKESFKNSENWSFRQSMSGNESKDFQQSLLLPEVNSCEHVDEVIEDWIKWQSHIAPSAREDEESKFKESLLLLKKSNSSVDLNEIFGLDIEDSSDKLVYCQFCNHSLDSNDLNVSGASTLSQHRVHPGFLGTSFSALSSSGDILDEPCFCSFCGLDCRYIDLLCKLEVDSNSDLTVGTGGGEASCEGDVLGVGDGKYRADLINRYCNNYCNDSDKYLNDIDELIDANHSLIDCRDCDDVTTTEKESKVTIFELIRQAWNFVQPAESGNESMPDEDD